jgi:hypothetical protein
MDLNQMINDSLIQIKASGKVEQIIRQRVEKTIESIINDLLDGWSEFGKELKNQIKEHLHINLQSLDIPAYNQLVANVVKEELDKALHIQGVQKMKEIIDNILGTAKREYKLSEIIKEMMEQANFDGDHNGSNATLHIERSSVLTFIYFDENEDVRKYDCKYRIFVDKDGSVKSVRIGNKEFQNDIIMGGLYGVEETLFKLYAQSSKLIIDEENIDLYYNEDGDD